MKPTRKIHSGATGVKTDTNDNAARAKLGLRTNVITELRGAGAPVNVLETNCGLEGRMSAAWSTADLLEGIDVKYRPWDARRRYIGDALIILRDIDLERFNVFDVDPYGYPWSYLRRLERRRWKAGELGALVVTDGGYLGLIWGERNAPPELRHYVPRLSLPKKAGSTRDTRRTASLADVHRQAIAAWLSRCGLTLVRRWEIEGAGGAHREMLYSSIVFVA